MKKLLLVLMLVAMASFLFVGCMPTPVPTPPVITTTSLPAGVVGTPYTATVNATPAAASDTLTFTLSAAPTGMVITSTTNGVGVLSGWTPAAAGTFNATVTVTDGTTPVSSTFTITIAAVPVPAQEITIGVATEWTDTLTGKTYVKAGANLITVTFKNAVATPVVKVGTVEVPMFTVDSKVYTGTGSFVGPCDAVVIYVSGVCEDLCATKSVVADSGKPYAELKATVSNSLCACETGYALTVTNVWSATTDCGSVPGCCGDDCSGLEEWDIAVYDEDPYKDCCADDPCVDPIKVATGTACPITITTECIDEVWTTDMEWVDFFDSDYWVIASLTDNVGNTISYYGRVEATSTTDVKFVELHHDPTTLVCLCDAEDSASADAIIGDCDGTPTTGCYVAPIPALTCPVVTPLVATVDLEATFTVTFNRDVVAADGKILAYVSDGAKSTPLNIPDNALPLFLVQSTTDLKVFTGEITFDTAGSKVLYVLWGDEWCMKEINVGGIALCPEFAWYNAVTGTPLTEGVNGWVDANGVSWLKGGNTYRLRLTFDHVISEDQKKLYQVTIQDYPTTQSEIFTDFRILDDMTTTDNMVFRGDFTPPAGDYCTEAYVEVDILGDCCEPCMFKFGVDAELPTAEIAITAVDCCGYAFLEFDSTPIICDDTCCVDTCTSVVGWTIDVYDTEPIWDCCVLQTTPAPVCSHEGTECPIDVSQGTACAGEPCCLDTGDKWIITTLTDAVGNVNAYYGKVALTGIPGDWDLVGTEYFWTCDNASTDDNPWDDPTSTEGMTNGTPAVGAQSNVEIYGTPCSL